MYLIIVILKEDIIKVQRLIQHSRLLVTIWINYVKPRDMRIDVQASTLHYFHMYAVCDRLDTSQLSEELPQPE